MKAIKMWRRWGIAGLTGLLLIAAPSAIAQHKAASSAAAEPRAAMIQPFVIVETRKGFATLQQAVDAIGTGRGTIRIASGRYRQCAVQQAGSISYVAAEAGGAIFEAALCEGRAALLLRGTAARMDGLVFQHMIAGKDEARSATAILLESGSLSITNSLFRTSDAALQTAGLANVTVNISQSSFLRLGRCPSGGAGCSSGVALGQIARLRLISSHFSGSAGGPLLSSRAKILDAEHNRFEDSPDDRSGDAAAAPMLALPSGAAGRIRYNEFLLHRASYGVQSALIAVAEDGRDNESRGLVIDENSAIWAAPDDGHEDHAHNGRKSGAGALFVANYSGEPVAVGHNELNAGIAAYQRPTAPAR